MTRRPARRDGGDVFSARRLFRGGAQAMKAVGKKQLLLTALFAVYMFVFMMTLIFLDSSLWALQGG